MGFKSFIFGLVEKKISNMYDNWKEAEKGKIMSASSEKTLKKGINLFGQASTALGGITELLAQPMQAGRQMAQTEADFFISKMFSPISRELRWFGGRLDAQWGDFYYENRAGGFIGKYIGMGIGTLAGFFLPGGPVLWATIGGTAGEAIGPFAQDTLFGERQGLVEGFLDSPFYTPPDGEIVDIVYDRTGPTILNQLQQLKYESVRAKKINEMSWI